MGADIHMVLEQRFEDRWVGLHDYPYINKTAVESDSGTPLSRYFFWKATNRNYKLFAAIAGVRGEGPDPKGVPDDASDLAHLAIESYGGDGHSHTWLSEEEAIRTWAPYVLKDGDWVAPERRQKVGDYLGMDDVGRDQYRLVIFFDN
jgi:hypothetical protein